MNRVIVIALSLSSTIGLAQKGNVGINTTNPQATLHISLNDDNKLTSATTNAGILIPSLDKERVASIDEANLVDGTLIYVNANYTYAPTDTTVKARVEEIDKEGFYYYSGKGKKWYHIYTDTDTNTTAPKFDFIVSVDGTKLIKWLNPDTEHIDMTTLPDMEGVTKIAQDLLAKNTQVQSFKMREGVTTIGARAFQRSPQIVFTFPQSLQVIEDYAFQSNRTITTLDLPNLTTIKANAFDFVTTLTSITLSKITTMGSSLFAGTSQTITITINNTTPPDIQSDTFKSNIIIKVPSESLSTYQSAWADKLNGATLEAL